MKNKPLFIIMTILLVFGLAAAGCGSAPESASEAPTAEPVQPADEPAAEEPLEEVQEAGAAEPANPDDIIIGYDVDERTSEQKLADLEQACQELGIQCVQGGSISELAEQGVDAIITFSSCWNVLGDGPEIYDAAQAKGIPLYVLDAETDTEGVYNLAFDLSWLQTSLRWTFDQMGDSGKMAYVSLGPDSYKGVIQEELDQHPNIQATEISASFDDMSAISQENIAAMVAEEPDLGAIWLSDVQPSIFWGLNDMAGDHFPAIECTARQEELQSWKDRVEAQPAFQCIATVKPGGNAYEAVYVAYYRLMGKELDPAALGGIFGNTLLYGDTVITNDNLDEWLAKSGDLRAGDWGALQLPPMTPEEILDKWFLD